MKQNNPFFIIGLTGGAGSGKSTIVDFLQKHVPVVYLHCDEIAHELMEPGKQSYLALVEEYGRGILTTEETACRKENSYQQPPIDREKLAKVALATEAARKRLNEITHPAVLNEVSRRLNELKEEGFFGIAIIEAALLIESGYTRVCDEIWYVFAPEEDRRRRMKENRGYSEAKIEHILAGQLSEQEFRKHSDFIIENSDYYGYEKEPLLARIKERLGTA